MSIRAIDALGDWKCGKGVQDYLVGNAEIGEDIDTALKIFLGEVFFATDFGGDWWNLIGSRDQQGIILQCRTMIASRNGVARINSVTAEFDGRQLFISYDVDTIYSRNITNTVTVP